MRNPVARIIAGIFACLILGGCCTSVMVPRDRSLDQAPTITIDAFPVDSGDIEHQNISSTGTVKVSRGKQYMISATAVNAVGGVQHLTVAIVQSGQTIFSTSVDQAKDSSGSSCTTLSLLGTGPRNNQAMTVTMSDIVTVTSTATNFNGMSSTITVTYVPTDLQVSLTAIPTTIGYQNPPTSSLAWSVLYGVPPYTMTMSPQVVSGSLANTTSATVQPTKTTTYSLQVKDQVSVQSASVTVDVVAPPPPPSISFSVSPNDGYNCLGTIDTIMWTVNDCPASSCDVELHGQGVGYASGITIALSHLPTTGQYTIKPSDAVNFTLSASSCPVCSASKTFQVSIAPPSVCQSSKPPTLMTYYFAVTGPNGCLGTIAVATDNLADAQAIALANYGSGYSLKQITADDFVNGRGC